MTSVTRALRFMVVGTTGIYLPVLMGAVGGVKIGLFFACFEVVIGISLYFND